MNPSMLMSALIAGVGNKPERTEGIVRPLRAFSTSELNPINF